MKALIISSSVLTSIPLELVIGQGLLDHPDRVKMLSAVELHCTDVGLDRSIGKGFLETTVQHEPFLREECIRFVENGDQSLHKKLEKNRLGRLKTQSKVIIRRNQLSFSREYFGRSQRAGQRIER